MARITSEKAVEAIGNRYDLVLVASRRTRELSNNWAPKISSTHGPIVTALREIEQGKIGIDYLYKNLNLDRHERLGKDK